MDKADHVSVKTCEGIRLAGDWFTGFSTARKPVGLGCPLDTLDQHFQM